MKKILIVLLNVVIIFTFIGLNYTVSFASEGSISVPASVNVGDSFTVTVNIPSDAVGYQGEISVKFSDGSVQNSNVLTVVTGITGDYAHPGNMSYQFSAAVEGKATITVSNLKITDRNANRINSNTTLTSSISVVKKTETPVQPTTPTTPSTPSNPNTPSTEQYSPAQNQATSNSTTITNTETANTTNVATNTIEEPSWRETGDTVYATTNMNVRSGWDKSFDSIGGLFKGDSTTRIAVGSNGWDKIKYNGKTAYVLSRLLTTEIVKPDEKDENEAAENQVAENQVTNTNRIDVTANMTDEDKEIYNQLVEEVGVLPTVGKNFADYVYVISVALTIVMIGFIGLKIRQKDCI